MSKRRRFVILPTDTAGYGRHLAQGLRELGETCHYINTADDKFDYGDVEASSRLVRTLNRLASHRHRGNAPTRLMSRVAMVPLRVLTAAVLLNGSSVAISLSGRGLLRGVDLAWARRRGARIITVYLGSDSRPPYLNGVLVYDGQEPDWEAVRRSTQRTARAVRRAVRRSHVVVCNPASAHFLDGEFVNWLAVGLPVQIAQRADSHARHREGKDGLVVVHAPTRPRQKGTAEFKRAMADVDSPIDIDFRVLTGVPHDEVMQALGSADLVLDELYSDTPLGAFATEAAAAGCPVLTFGYAQDLLSLASTPRDLPRDAYALPEDMPGLLVRALQDDEWRRHVTEQVHEFATRHWTPRAVAARFIRLADGGPPAEWLVHPSSVTYWEGFGMPRETARERLRQFVGMFGERALELEASSPARSVILREVSARPSRSGHTTHDPEEGTTTAWTQ